MHRRLSSSPQSSLRTRDEPARAGRRSRTSSSYHLLVRELHSGIQTSAARTRGVITRINAELVSAQTRTVELEQTIERRSTALVDLQTQMFSLQNRTTELE